MTSLYWTVQAVVLGQITTMKLISDLQWNHKKFAGRCLWLKAVLQGLQLSQIILCGWRGSERSRKRSRKVSIWNWHFGRGAGFKTAGFYLKEENPVKMTHLWLSLLFPLEFSTYMLFFLLWDRHEDISLWMF